VKKKFDWLLQEYNYDENNIEMNLVLFDDALSHITNIYRILRFPLGHALLVGYGGSGKQSLTKLALFTAKYRLFMITLTRGYKEKEFREDLKNLLSLLTEGPVVFLFTDAHVLEEGFLELINNLLTIGMVPALFDEEEKKNMSDKIKDEAKKAGVQETKEDLWNYFVEKTRNNLHIVLAMSPAGSTLRIRCRNFPGLISSTSIDWFFNWPKEALVSVADFYLKDTELPSENRGEIVSHIVGVHLSVQEYSAEFEAQLKRKNFATPKNYLDFLKTYNISLEKNTKEFHQLVTRYVNGLAKLKEAKESVSILREDLEIKQKEVNAETKEVETLLAEIEVIQVNVEKNQTAAVAKEKELDVEVEEIEKQKAKADEILKNAEPQVL
jgi:dynein heavy chain, axonemal